MDHENVHTYVHALQTELMMDEKSALSMATGQTSMGQLFRVEKNVLLFKKDRHLFSSNPTNNITIIIIMTIHL
jgi:hypothetical protein